MLEVDTLFEMVLAVYEELRLEANPIPKKPTLLVAA
jgi:hypothetical protein